MNKVDLENAIRKFMREQKIKQTDLAEAIGVQQSIISDMLNGKRRVDRIIEYLNTTYGTSLELPSEDSNVVPVEEQEKRLYVTNTHGVKFFEQEDGSLLMEVPKVPYFALGSPEDEFATLYNNNENTDPVMLKVDMANTLLLMLSEIPWMMERGNRLSMVTPSSSGNSTRVTGCPVCTSISGSTGWSAGGTA